MQDIEHVTGARQAASFHLNMALLMLHAGRDEEARDAFHKLVAVIEALPPDLEVALPLDAVR